MNDIIVRIVPLPAGTDAYVMEDPAGDYNVYISSQINTERQKISCIHEILHIKKGHLDDHCKTASECESEIREVLRMAPEHRSEKR